MDRRGGAARSAALRRCRCRIAGREAVSLPEVRRGVSALLPVLLVFLIDLMHSQSPEPTPLQSAEGHFFFEPPLWVERRPSPKPRSGEGAPPSDPPLLLNGEVRPKAAARVAPWLWALL